MFSAYKFVILLFTATVLFLCTLFVLQEWVIIFRKPPHTHVIPKVGCHDFNSFNQMFMSLTLLFTYVKAAVSTSPSRKTFILSSNLRERSCMQH